MTDEERKDIIDRLARDPEAGNLIPGTGGARKFRFRRGHQGRRGRYRVITFYAGEDVPVFLLNVFAKGDRVDLSQAERNALRKELAGLAEDYRQGVHRHVQSW